MGEADGTYRKGLSKWPLPPEVDLTGFESKWPPDGENMVTDEQSKSEDKLGDKQAWSEGDGGERQYSGNEDSGDDRGKSRSQSEDGNRPRSKSV
jgi:hypothetical protein